MKNRYLSDSSDSDDNKYNLLKEENTTLSENLEQGDTDSSKTIDSNTKFKTVQKQQNSKTAIFYISIQNFHEEAERTNKEFNLRLIKDLLKEILSLSEQNAQKIIDTNIQLGFRIGTYQKVAGWQFKFETEIAKATRMIEIVSLRTNEVYFFFHAHKDYMLQKLTTYKYRYQTNSNYSILHKIEQPKPEDCLQEQNNKNIQPQQSIIEINFPALNQNSQINQDKSQNIQNNNQNRDNSKQIKLLKEQIKQKEIEKMYKGYQIGKLNEQIEQQQELIEELTLKIKQILN